MRIQGVVLLLWILFSLTTFSHAATPRIDGLSPGSGPVGTSLQINGLWFGTTQGSSTVTINGTNATATSWSDSQIVVTIPTTAKTGPVQVTVGGVASNINVYFTVPPPRINSISPTSGVIGTQVTVTGSGFQGTQGSSSIFFNNLSGSVVSWSDTQVVANVAAGTTGGPVKITVNGVQSNQDVILTLPNPIITGLSPGTAPVGSQVQINGSGFGATQGSSTATFNGVGSSVVSWSDNQIIATAPATAVTGPVKVTDGGVPSNQNVVFTVPSPRVDRLSPNSGVVGAQVTINGAGFQAVKGSSAITFNNQTANVVSWSDSQIVATVPTSTTTGPVKITVNGVVSNQDVIFTLPSPTVTGLSPGSGPVGTQVQINGSGFGATQGSSTVTFNGVTASIVNWSDGQILATVPTAAISGAVMVTEGGVSSNSNVIFTIPAPRVDSLSPNSGVVGTQVTVNGAGFQAAKGSSSITFNGQTASVVSWNDTQIVATVPANAISGPVKLTVNGVVSNQDVIFTLPSPAITSLSPSRGPLGTSVQINGSGFGATQGSSTVSFANTNATVSSWSDTQVIASVPAGATTGQVKITEGGVASNTLSFTVGNVLVNSVSPRAGPVGTQVTVSGQGFGASQGSSTVSFNNTSATVSNWTDTQIVAAVPTGATTGAVKVTVSGAASNTDVVFTVAAVAVNSISPTNGAVGTQVQVNGSGFGSTQGSSTVTFNGVGASIVSWSATQITASAPSAATTGPVKVAVGGVNSNTDVLFTIPGPQVTSISPANGVVGTQVTVSGSGFQATRGSSSLQINGVTASSIVSWSDTQIVASVPAGTTTGPVKVFVNGVPSNQNVVFTMPKPGISGLSPASGAVGTQVQINGNGFGAAQGTSTITFNAVSTSITSWSDSQIVATVPTTATTGLVQATVGGVVSTPNVYFSVAGPWISTISPASGVVGTQVTVSGSGFQTTRGSSSLQINSVTASSIVSWSDTQIVGTVPAGTTTGPVKVTVNGVASNQNVIFTLPKPTISGLSPASGPVGTQVQINGSGFGTTQGSSTLTFNSLNATVVSWSDTQVVATVPAAATTGLVQMVVGGVTSTPNTTFSIPGPRVDSISPSSGVVGAQITINGSGFQATRGGSSVALGPVGLTVVSWSDTQIVATVPAGAASGPIKVTVNGSTSPQNVIFTMPNPLITGLTPASGPVNTQVQINGSGFGSTQGSSTIAFNGVSATVVTWSDSQVVAKAPTTAVTGPVKITEGGVVSNTNYYFSIPAPRIDNVSPAAGGAGNSVTITGAYFQSSQGTSSVSFVGGFATVTSWSDTQITAIVPANAVTGPLQVTVNSTVSNPFNYTVPSFAISSVSPTSGPVGSQVTVNGSGFGSTQGTSAITFNGSAPSSITSWNNTQIVATVSPTTTTGPVKVVVNNVNSNVTVNFTVPPPSISAVSPSGGSAGTQVTVSGSGFQATQRDSRLQINGVATTIASWSDSQIVATVPASASTGPVTVNVNSIQSNSNFAFTVPNQSITSLAPPAAAIGASVVITGSGFGSTAGNSLVKFNGVQASVSSWSDTSVTAVVPSNATSGPVTMTMFNVTSNGVQFTVGAVPTVASVSPTTGPVGSTITLAGSGFGTAQSNSAVTFDGVAATVTSWSDTQVVATVPLGATTGPVSVTVGGLIGQSPTFVVNATLQLANSLGYSSNYTAVIMGGKWYVSDSQGAGCSSCTQRGVVHNTFDSRGNILSTTDELGNTTTYTYDVSNNVTSESRQFDANTTATTSYTYNSFGEVLTVTDALGNTTTNGYDANGNLTSITAPVPSGGTPASVTQLAYDNKGQLTQIIDPLNHTTTLTYTPAGLISTITDAQQHVTSYEYDARGNRTAIVDAANKRITFTYDLGNRLTSITYPDQSSATFGYDSRGRRTSVTDQNGKATTYGYDDADRLMAVTDPAQNTTLYSYDSENNLLNITDAKGHATSFSYDPFGRVTQTAFPSSLTETYTYDAVGNLTSKTDRKQQTILYVYDALNRLTHKGYPDSTGVDYVYDLVGKIRQVTDPTGTYGFSYDSMGRLIGTTTQYTFLPGHTYSNSYNYDSASNRTGMTAPDGSTNTYAYDTLNRLSTLTNSLTGQFGFSYDALSRRTQLTRLNGVSSNYTYDSVSHLLSVSHQAGATTLDGASYTYDAAGNRTSKTNYLNGITENYTYDPIYQLLQVTQGNVTTESYTHDPVGNRLSSLNVPTYAYNSSNQLTSASATYTYDANGNTLGDGSKSYTWDFENRLTSVIVPGTGTTTFRYDPFGRRIQKSGPLGATNFLYDADNVVEEADQSGNALARYTQGLDVDEELAELRSGTATYYLADGIGSITSLTNSAGAVGGTYTYDTFGNLTASTGTLVNPFGFTGREVDSETGLSFLRHRYYSPLTGRFLSEDPIGFQGGKNFYQYVRNSPVNFVDPFGEKTDVIIVYDSGPFGLWSYGSHAALYVDNGGDPILYDPAGGYTTDHKCGSGDACSDEDADVNKFKSYHTKHGSTVRVFEFDTTPDQEAQIAQNIEKQGGASGGHCALSVADALNGIGPFKTLKRKFWPGSLADELAKLPTDCQCKKQK